MAKLQLWLRWSRRDLRERWLQVMAIALIIALGSGVYAGLGSDVPWRENSFDESYELLNMYDLRVGLPENSFLLADELLAVVQGIEHANWIKAVEPRLLVPTLVEASNDETVLVPGRIMGIDVADGGPHVNGIYIKEGQGLTASDAGQYRAVLEYSFALYYDLPKQGQIQISGGQTLDYVGQGMTPEYFMVIANEIGFKDEANYAVVMIPLETAQSLTGHSGQANDLVLTLEDGADRDLVRTEIDDAIMQKFGDINPTFTNKEDDPCRDALYADIKGDEQIFDFIAYLFLLGAAFGTFNLTSRIVEAQRRQIGIGMALGVPRRMLALRPLLVGIQIAVLGVILGIGVGLVINAIFAKIVQDLMPMPVFHADFQVGIFSKAAALGIILPFLATLYPVWRAVRVQPVDAIRTGYLVAKGGGLAPRLARVPVPGRSFTQMPIRNLLRAPRRTALTLLGVGAAITTLIAMLGMVDSLLSVIDKGEEEYLQGKPDRMIVTLDQLFALDSDQVKSILALAQPSETQKLSAAEPGIQSGVELSSGSEKLEVSVELIDLNNTLWTPTLVEGKLPSGDRSGILINDKAARDLDVKVGDTIMVKHPYWDENSPVPLAGNTEVQVAGIHANPMRFLTYMSIDQAGMMGLAGQTNLLYVNPARGVSQSDARRALFGLQGVASAKTAASFTETLRAMMDLLIGFMYIVAVAVMVLAFLIAYNTSSINVDERAREIATLFAFGLPVRTVTRMAMIENLITGILGTVVGMGLGFVALTWMMKSLLGEEIPDISQPVTVSALTLGIAIMLGVVVVALTPLLSIRKMARMDLPSTLRVME